MCGGTWVDVEIRVHDEYRHWVVFKFIVFPIVVVAPIHFPCILNTTMRLELGSKQISLYDKSRCCLRRVNMSSSRTAASGLHTIVPLQFSRFVLNCCVTLCSARHMVISQLWGYPCCAVACGSPWINKRHTLSFGHRSAKNAINIKTSKHKKTLLNIITHLNIKNFFNTKTNVQH